MSGRQFILEIEGFERGLPLTTGNFSYSFPELGVGQFPREDKETGKVKITSLFVQRAGDKFTPQFVNYAFSGKMFPKISLMNFVTVRDRCEFNGYKKIDFGRVF